jgi:DNA-nicking Smr family endonuclease
MKPVAKPVSDWRLRSLTRDEEDLWSLVARTVRPLRPLPAARKAPQLTIDAGNGAVRDTVRAVKKAPAPQPKAAAREPRAGAPPALSPIMRKEKHKLARGRDTIDARIDLHGMTQTQAHAALRSLLQRCQANGAKFVLVITGKGLPNESLGGRGVLRRQVPQWLALPEFRRYVAGFDVAHAGHGGEGALYVRVRKAKTAR